MTINGEITPPGDKSISHRAFMFAALARGTSTVRSALDSDDIASTRRAMQALGASIERRGDLWVVEGRGLHEPSGVIDAGNSGTTARLLCGILTGIDGVTTLTGDASLVQRPMGRVIEPLGRMGAAFLARGGRFLPLAVRGGRLSAIEHDMPVASAQVKSAVLLAGLGAPGRTTLSEPAPSRDHTERMLAFCGVKLEAGPRRVALEGPQELQARDMIVPGDPSSAAFAAVWAAGTPGSELLIKGVCLNPTRTAFLDVLQRMGAQIEITNQHQAAGETVGDLFLRGAQLTATTIEGAEIPGLIDEIPILAVAAALAEGTTVIRDAAELRVKETDRIRALAEGFAALGIPLEERADGLVIAGPLRPQPGTVRTHADHRIAMAFHILARASGVSIHLDDTACVAISYPGFFQAMQELS